MSHFNLDITASFNEPAPEPNELIEALGELLLELGAHTVLTKLTNEVSVVALKRRQDQESDE